MPVYDLESVEEGVKSEQPDVSKGNGSAEEKTLKVEDVLESGKENTVEKTKEVSYEKVLEKASTSSQAVSVQSAASIQDDVSAIASVDEQTKIEKLVHIAMEKSPEYAFKVAIRLDDMYALDMLHDRLSHQLYQELIAKGLLKENL